MLIKCFHVLVNVYKFEAFGRVCMPKYRYLLRDVLIGLIVVHYFTAVLNTT